MKNLIDPYEAVGHVLEKAFSYRLLRTLGALPKMARAASSDDSRQGFEQHLEQTKGHVQRLEKIFQALGESPKGKLLPATSEIAAVPELFSGALYIGHDRL